MIRFEQVKKVLSGKTVLDIADLTIPSGSIYGLIGANGAGKSTMLRLISGVYQADGGIVMVDGENIYDNAVMKEKIFFVSDDPYFLPQVTLEEMASFYRNYYKKFDTALYERLCESFQLPTRNKLSTYSKGMRRQAIILLALAIAPEVLLLDESFDGLDPVMRHKVRQILVEISTEREITVVISSHNLRELDELCDSVGIIHRGKLLYNITLDALKDEVHKYQLAFSQPVEQELFAALAPMSCELVGKFATIVVRGERETLQAKIEALRPVAVEEFPLDLEEIFIYEMEEKGYDYKYIFS